MALPSKLLGAYAYTASARLQATWVIDPQDSTGRASDYNSGLDSTTPLLTMGECIRRCGCQPGFFTPELPQTTTITFLSDQPPGVDQFLAEPTMLNGAEFWIIGGLVTVSSGTFGAFTARNQSSGTLDSATLGAASAAAGDIVENTTHPGRAWIDSFDSPTATLTPPMALASGYPTAAFLPWVTNWATGNAFVVKRPIKLNLKSFAPRASQWNPSSYEQNSFLIQAWVVDDNPNSPGGTLFILGVNAQAQECRFDVFVQTQDSQQTEAEIDNCWMTGGGYYRYVNVFGGGIDASFQQLGTAVQNGGFLDGGCVVHGPILCLGDVGLGQVYCDTTFTLEGGTISLISSGYGSFKGILYGPASLGVNDGSYLGLASAQTAASTLLMTGGITIQGASTASTYSAGTWTAGISVTAANIDSHTGLVDPLSGSRVARNWV